jgi:hypothetical protein
MKRVPIVILAGLLSGVTLAQTTPQQPASLTITPSTMPEVLQVLDNTGTWVPMGLINTTKHSFTAVGGEADILVTDPAIGMAANNGQDNSPFVDALMLKQMPPAWGGYDVLFPAIHGATQTVYYFTEPFVNKRAGNYHCAGSVGYLSTYLVFAPGVDGFIQEGNAWTSDGTIGGGILSSCQIISLGFGTAIVDTASPTKLTSVSFAGMPGFPSPAATPVWHVGDSLLLTASNGYYPIEAIFPVPIGTTITAVDGTTGDLTMSNPITQSFGHVFLPKASVTFTQTGTNNFSANDRITVGDITYTFRNYSLVPAAGNAVPHDVLLGANFAASANNLVAAITGGAGQYSTYGPENQGPGAYGANLLVTASYASGVITFTSNYGPPNANTYPAVYTPTGTAAGVFSGATFSGANATSGPQNIGFYQLPKSQEFKIQTVAGSPNVTVVSGPRLLKGGDVIWSDAFRFGSTIDTASGTVGAQTLHMSDAVNTAGDNPATVTHAPGAEASLWILPAGLKRRTPANAKNNYFYQWPIGLQMSCGSNGGNNCDLSRDEANNHDYNFVGRWVAGNNTATASSKDDQFAHNYLMDVWEGGTLGEIYYNLNLESPETGSSKFGIVQNCANLNYTTIFGGYIGGGPGCTRDEFAFPPTYGGPVIFGALSGASTGALSQVQHNFNNGINVTGGPDTAQCVSLSGPAYEWWAIAFSFGGCDNTGTELALQWNGGGVWSWSMGGPSGAQPMMFLNTAWGFPGYAGPTGRVTYFSPGVLLRDIDSYQTSLLSMSNNPPITTPRQSGDVVFYTGNTTGGGPAGWYDAGGTFKPFAQIAHDAAGTSWPVGTLTYIANLAPCAGDGSIGLGVVADGQTAVAAGYNAAIGAGGGSTRRLVFCDGTSWTYH